MNLFIQLVICVAVASSYIEATSEKLDKGFDRWRRSPPQDPQSVPPAVPVTPAVPPAVPVTPAVPPAVPVTSETCHKDILLMLDTSNSIGSTNFVKIKTFLKSFIQNERLDVQESGTQLAMIIFSGENVKKTKVMFGFGEKNEQNDLVTFIESMNYNELSGHGTYTGLALEKAETQIFTIRSPENARPTIQDVILLITDGKPYGRGGWNEMTFAENAATTLKERGVRIVSVLVGEDQSYLGGVAKDILSNLATRPELMFTAEIDSINGIMDELLDASCNILQEGDCHCGVPAGNPVAPKYLTPDRTEAIVEWAEPTVTCENNANPISKIVIPPDITSPHSFPVGQHPITYTHTFRGGLELVCTVDIDVKIIPCGGTDYTPATEKCCCGKVWRIKSGYTCCGKRYFKESTKQCCPYYNVVLKVDNCPGA